MKNRERDIYDYWQEKSDIFDEHYEKSGFTHNFLKIRNEKIMSLLSFKNKKVIDIGCGSGLFMKDCINKGASFVTGLDYSNQMLDIAKHKLKDFTDKTDFILGGVSPLPIKDKQYDVILAIGLLDYIKNVEQVLKEFYRVLKPNGEAIITIPKKWSPFFFLRIRTIGKYIRQWFLKIPEIITWVNFKEAKSLLESAGFSIDKIQVIQKTMWIFKVKKK